MLSNTDSKTPSPPTPSGTAEAPAVLDPHAPIEVASSGTGTTIDPSGKDNHPPPGVYDVDSFA